GAAAPSRTAAGRQAAARSAGRQQSAAVRGRDQGPRTRNVAWQSGLAPATNAQAATCPAGTLATLARGHSDIVRCLPL
ncbi:hypothetical protein J5Y09_02420, partial [Roseomonas sp. PWR1]|nr:hypothetical protein [Neoroseomonas nitratireducens]